MKVEWEDSDEDLEEKDLNNRISGFMNKELTIPKEENASTARR